MPFGAYYFMEMQYFMVYYLMGIIISLLIASADPVIRYEFQEQQHLKSMVAAYHRMCRLFDNGGVTRPDLLPNPLMSIDFSMKMGPTTFEIDKSCHCSQLSLWIFSKTYVLVPKLAGMLD